MRFNPITAFAVASVISVQSAEAWSIQFQDYSAQTPECSEKLTNMTIFVVRLDCLRERMQHLIYIYT